MELSLDLNMNAGLGAGGSVEPKVAQNIFDHATVTVPGDNETGVPVSLGVVFQSITQGEIGAISFYKSAGDDATSRTVGLFSDTGVLIGGGSSSGETPSVAGWVSVDLDVPAAIDANIKYVAGVHYPNGSYPFQAAVFVGPVVRGDLIAEGTIAAPGNGRFNYGPTLEYPDTTASGGSFGVDVDFFSDP